jgi:hypothetical protein
VSAGTKRRCATGLVYGESPVILPPVGMKRLRLPGLDALGRRPYVRLVLVRYPEEMSLLDARRVYFETNGFGADGGYGDKWVDFKLGKVPFPIPNSPSRVRAVRFHDLHHVLTGYDTNTIGEFEISAWEIAGGCKSFAAAWALNLSGMVAGMLVAPRRTYRAFVRGRRSRTLYGEPFEPLLEMTVREAREKYLGPEAEPAAGGIAGAATFAAALVAGLIVSLIMMAIVVPLVPFGLAARSMIRAS